MRALPRHASRDTALHLERATLALDLGWGGVDGRRPHRVRRVGLALHLQGTAGMILVRPGLSVIDIATLGVSRSPIRARTGPGLVAVAVRPRTRGLHGHRLAGVGRG